MIAITIYLILIDFNNPFHPLTDLSFFLHFIVINKNEIDNYS